MPRRRLIHLSDLHLKRPDQLDSPQFRWLIATLKTVAAAERGPLALVVTGDILDDAPQCANAVNENAVSQIASGLVDKLEDAVQARDEKCPIVLLPGNHDRRGGGVVGPWRSWPMKAIAQSIKGRSAVVASAEPSEPLAQGLETLSGIMGFPVIAYDTTHALSGCFSAGGRIRVEDLFSAIGNVGDTRPLMLLMHHHLIPTPTTDLGRVVVPEGNAVERAVKRWLLHKAAPTVISFADREELFMTALGAGTALSALASLGRPVFVLHGHKHIPTVRLMTGTRSEHGDVMLIAAGAAGVAESFSLAPDALDPSMWPSFNVFAYDAASQKFDTKSYYYPPGPKKDGLQEPAGRKEFDKTLIVGSVQGQRLVAAPDAVASTAAFSNDLDEAVFAIQDNGPAARWSFKCSRLVRPLDPQGAGNTSESYREYIGAAPDASFSGDARGNWLTIHPGTQASYAVQRGLFASAKDAMAAEKSDFSPFEWVGLRVRRATRTAKLTVGGLPSNVQPFATLTDMDNGQMSAINVSGPDNGLWRVVVANCPARHLLRLHWRLAP